MTPEQDDQRMLGALLRIPFQATVTRIDAGLSAEGFTDLRPAHFVVFQLLPPEGARVTELAEQAQMTKQSMGELVDYIERCGYVERVADPKDGRARIIRLTARGQALDRAARDILRRTEAEWAGKLGGARMAELKQTLRDLIAALEEGAS